MSMRFNAFIYRLDYYNHVSNCPRVDKKRFLKFISFENLSWIIIRYIPWESVFTRLCTLELHEVRLCCLLTSKTKCLQDLSQPNVFFSILQVDCVDMTFIPFKSCLHEQTVHMNAPLQPIILWPAGAVGSGGVHQGRKGHCIQAVCGNDPDAHRGSPCCLPQTDEHGQAAHLCRDRQRPLRVPAAGEALHGPHHHQEQQHPGRPGDAQTVLPRGKNRQQTVLSWMDFIELALFGFELHLISDPLWSHQYHEKRWCVYFVTQKTNKFIKNV